MASRREKARGAAQRVAQQEDKQAMEEKTISSFSPDRTTATRLPSRQPIRRAGAHIGAPKGPKTLLPLPPMPPVRVASPSPTRSMSSPQPEFSVDTSMGRVQTPTGDLSDDGTNMEDDANIPDPEPSDYPTTSVSEATTDSEGADSFGPLWNPHDLDEEEEDAEEEAVIQARNLRMQELHDRAAMIEDDTMSSDEYKLRSDDGDKDILAENDIGDMSVTDDEVDVALARLQAEMAALKKRKAAGKKPAVGRELAPEVCYPCHCFGQTYT